MPWSRWAGVRPWLAAGAFLLLIWAADSLEKAPRGAIIALDAEDAAAVCPREESAAFWERAKAMGVGAMALPAATIGELAGRGQVLAFTSGELEKWKSVGLIAPGASLKSNVLWVKDPRIFMRVAEALRAHGVVLGTSTANGHGLIELSREPDAAMPAGLDPDDLGLAASLGLAAFRLDAGGDASKIMGAGAGLPDLLRAVYGQPGRLIVLRMDRGAGAEENLSRLRALLRPLREEGLIGRERAVVISSPGGPISRWRRWLAWFLAVVGPIVAVRSGVKAFKRARAVVRERRPIASPVAELILGLSAVAAAAAAAGLAVRLCLAGDSARPLPEGLAFSTMAWPLAIGALALYPLSPKVLARRLRGSPTYADILRWAVLILAAALLFRPRLIFLGTPLWYWLQAAADASARFWWWPWRWREFIVGLPALMLALFLVGRQLDAEAPHAGRGRFEDPRPWLWLGIFFPIGTIAALGRPGMSIYMVLGHTTLVLAAGLMLGGAFLAFTSVWDTLGKTRPKKLTKE